MQDNAHSNIRPNLQYLVLSLCAGLMHGLASPQHSLKRIADHTGVLPVIVSFTDSKLLNVGHTKVIHTISLKEQIM